MDISEEFDQIWHGVFYKLKLLWICSRNYDLIQSFLNNRHQRVRLNGQSSKWYLVEAGVPQDSIFDPLFFIVYINDLRQDLCCNANLFADDTSLFSTIISPVIPSSLNEHLLKITQQAYQWKMSFNPDITKQNKKFFSSQEKWSMSLLREVCSIFWNWLFTQLMYLQFMQESAFEFCSNSRFQFLQITRKRRAWSLLIHVWPVWTII